MSKREPKRTKTSQHAADGGGELHPVSPDPAHDLTTNQGTVVSDDQNSLRGGVRGVTLLEDFVLREKITHFDHERIPERIVHARGSGAHGFFQVLRPMTDLTSAAFLQDPEVTTPVFVRFSTVAGGAGSVDLPRDVRGFAVKFYTSAGNFDLVGNNIPVFFIQDAMKFPDLVHAVKMEPDRGFPQAASAHDTFWDFISLMPESVHMIMWAMSDRAIPRSFRTMEGFGIHTFRFVNAEGDATFVKFHWRPTIGSSSVLWDEAVKINGADPDFMRRDLWNAIARGDFPQFDFAIQAFDQEVADRFEFDILDATKLIPEEVVPLQVIGRLTLNRNPDNFFAETEQIAFHPGHLVPGIDFTNDPLLQGRLFSYLDTQLSRLGGPNFHQLPINQPKCPLRNFQRDGISQMERPIGRVAYEPNSLATDGGPRESPSRGFRTTPDGLTGDKVRTRSATFADHYSQARLFWQSMTESEQRHIVSALSFELSKVETVAVRRRMLGHLDIVAEELGHAVAHALGMDGQAEAITPARAPIALAPSPTLSLQKKALNTLAGRTVGLLMSDGTDPAFVDEIRRAIADAGARLETVAPRIGGIKTDGSAVAPDHALSGTPSVLFDAVVVALTAEAAGELSGQGAAVDWVRDAFRHLKAIGFQEGAAALLDRAGVSRDEGVVGLEGGGVDRFLAVAKAGRVWARETRV
jgi:catalase